MKRGCPVDSVTVKANDHKIWACLAKSHIDFNIKTQKLFGGGNPSMSY